LLWEFAKWTLEREPEVDSTPDPARVELCFAKLFEKY
jgi:hypothetical protein